MAILKRVSKTTGKRSWQVMIDRRDPFTNTRKRVTIGTFPTKKEAERAERDALTQQERGTLLDPAKTTVGELLDAWLATKAGSVSPNSLNDYEIAVRRHLKPAFGGVKVQSLTPSRVQDHYAAWQAAGMSPRMIHRCHIVLSQALAQAVRFGIVARNVSAEVTKPSLNRAMPNVWNPADVREFLTATSGDRLTPLWHLLALEGMRRGEALGLRWQDVNWERGAVHISQTVAPDKSNKGAAIILSRTKTHAGARSVRLSRQTIAALGEHRDRQRFQRQAAGDAWHDHDLIVCTSLGTPVNPNNVTRSYNRLVIAAGVPRIRVHDLRHTAATMLLRAGVPAKIVSERLGHASVGITMDLYSHVTPDMQDLAAEAMSALMEGATGTERQHYAGV